MRWLDKAEYKNVTSRLKVNDEVTIADLDGLRTVPDDDTTAKTIVLQYGDVVDLDEGEDGMAGEFSRATVVAVHSAHFNDETTYDVRDDSGDVFTHIPRERLRHRGKCWAKVTAVHEAADPANDTYDLLDADNNKLIGAKRSILHKRKWVSHAYTCFSDDRLHDSYQTQHFLDMQLEDALANLAESNSTDWLCDETYDSTTIALKKGDTVTVEDPSGTPYRATVHKVANNDSITVKNSDGARQTIHRKFLRKHEVQTNISLRDILLLLCR